MGTPSNKGFSKGSRGFALIGVLLLILIVSALAVSVAYLTMREKKVSGGDQDSNLAYYGAEGGLEKLSSELTYLYQQKQSPVQSDLDAIAANIPNLPGIKFTEYKITPVNPAPDGSLPAVGSAAPISAGPYAGMNALMVKLTSSVTAQALGGSQVRMVRNLEVALIPVFQFGMFSDTDLSFYNGTGMDFNGRVHSNQNLYLVPQGADTFHDKLSAVLNVIRQTMPTGESSYSQYQGNVAIPTRAGGCANKQAETGSSTPDCRFLGVSEGSANSAGPKALSFPASAAYNGYLANGVKALTLPFVNGTAFPIEIIRQPPESPNTESATSALGLSRFFNEAQIRVLLDDRALLPDGTPAFPAACSTVEGAGPQVGLVRLDIFPGTAVGNAGVGLNWRLPTLPANQNVSLLDTITWNNAAKTLNYTPTYLCVLGKDTAGNYFPVTNAWLAQGLERTNPTPNAISSPSSILNLQVTAPGPPGFRSWPINMYDAREGEFRPIGNGVTGSCALNGIMNLVELDVGHLTAWLASTALGQKVDNKPQNGYILYFSDRRGMLPNPNLPLTFKFTKNGVSGLEDILNLPVSGSGVPPNNRLDGTSSNGFFAEDVDHNGVLDDFGEANLGLGFGQPPTNPLWIPVPSSTRVPAAVAQQNIVAGPRHALRLVNGAGPGAFAPLLSPKVLGGFTVASEQPVYILGNYNASAADDSVLDPISGNLTWPSAHVATSVVADAVTLLSSTWSDTNSFLNSTNLGGRPATQTWFRTAVAAGKNQTFTGITDPGVTVNFGGDGGVHNFLRYLESWTGITSHYRGSMVSFFYSQYATGMFKYLYNGGVVYEAPTRSYSFDTDFLTISNMPPGTPMFRDVENVGGHQDFSAQ